MECYARNEFLSRNHLAQRRKGHEEKNSELGALGILARAMRGLSAASAVKAHESLKNIFV